MSQVIVLMYHALYANAAEREAIDPADRPYAVEVGEFLRQLDTLAELGIPVVRPPSLRAPAEAAGSEGEVLLTFDDGHGSNYRTVYPLLRERGLGAIFFVTSDFIGQRRGFCSGRELREMADGGMTIGSHGKTHRFFDDLSPTEVVAEYQQSKEAIERHTGRAVTLLSFPGGRFRRSQIAPGLAAGYRLFFSSRVGANNGAAFSDGGIIRRVAIRDVTPLAEFASIARGDWRWLARAQTIASAKGIIRRIAGNRLYHAMYERLST
jgi:peptidoglycan/xylan/chitin deacetylase (PgdA/CDA1 family)